MKPVFKPYNQGQISLFPERLDAYIPEDHPVRLVSAVVDKLDIMPILKTYKGGGTSSYHPRMLLKVLFYAYLMNIFSSRKIEKALRENIHFMWLSGKQFPDFRTINHFRSHRLKGQIQQIFSAIVMMLAEMGMIDITSTLYTDGTKIEANANKYSFVWRGSVNHNKEKLKKKLAGILQEIESHIKRDSQEENSPDFDSKDIDPEFLEKKINEINRQIKQNTQLPEKEKKKIERQIKKIKTKELPRLRTYIKQLEIMGPHRNSYSKTDPDATFMRMKDDVLGNGQLKAGYNLQISTQEQVILHYGIYQSRNDTDTYIDHLKKYQKAYKRLPATAVADAGYGSEQNYRFLEENQIEAYVKYNMFDKEQKKKFKEDIGKIEHLYYNEQEDYFVCPMGQKMTFRYTYDSYTQRGYKQEIRVYQAQNCGGCPVRGVCHSSKHDRKIHVNHRLLRYKAKAKEKLLSEEGIYHRKKRLIEPESVFGQIKQNKGFRRFSLRGLAKVEVEFGLVAIAHNLQKLWKWLLTGKTPMDLSKFFSWLKIFLSEIQKKSIYPVKRMTFRLSYS